MEVDIKDLGTTRIYLSESETSLSDASPEPDRVTHQGSQRSHFIWTKWLGDRFGI